MLQAASLVVLAGAFAGGFISGLAGFGTGLVALGIWLHVLDPAPAATLSAICSVVAQIQTIPLVWRAIDRRRVWPMIAAGILGVPVGTWLLSRVDPDEFRLGLGIFLVVFAATMLLARVRTRIVWGGRRADSVVGFLGGILGGLAGLSGPLPTVWATLRGWGKDERRGVFQAFNLSILAVVILWHGAAGMLDAALGWLVLIALPGTLLGARLGSQAYRRLSDHHFNRVVLGLLGISGLTLVWSSLGL